MEAAGWVPLIEKQGMHRVEKKLGSQSILVSVSFKVTDLCYALMVVIGTHV
jgi:hypothetical protein